MTKKQILTNAEIEKDIITALKNPPKQSEVSYKKSTLIAIIIAILLVILEFIYPTFILWLVPALVAFFVVYSIFNRVRLKYRIKNVTLNNYDITKETVHGTMEEHYKAERGGKIRRTEQIDNYAICFENGKNWRLPKELYSWTEEFRVSDWGIYQGAHREDVFIVVTNKHTNEIVVAYHTDVFEYKN